MNRRAFLSVVALAPFAKFLRPSIPAAKPEVAFEYCQCGDPPTNHLHSDPLIHDKYFEVDMDFSEEDLQRALEDFRNRKLS